MSTNNSVTTVNIKGTDIEPVKSATIQSLIYTIRGLQVMLDFDLARIYGYEVKTMNQQVKRNIARFPEDFMFQLTMEEVEMVKSQIVTSPGSSLLEHQLRMQERNALQFLS